MIGIGEGAILAAAVGVMVVMFVLVGALILLALIRKAARLMKLAIWMTGVAVVVCLAATGVIVATLMWAP